MKNRKPAEIGPSPIVINLGGVQSDDKKRKKDEEKKLRQKIFQEFEDAMTPEEKKKWQKRMDEIKGRVVQKVGKQIVEENK